MQGSFNEAKIFARHHGTHLAGQSGVARNVERAAAIDGCAEILEESDTCRARFDMCLDLIARARFNPFIEIFRQVSEKFAAFLRSRRARDIARRGRFT